MKQNVIVYHENLLPYSETFILGQTEALRRFTPYYVGTRRVEGIETPPERTLVFNPGTTLGRAEELLYKAVGLAPRLLPQLRSLNPALIHAHFGSDGAMALPLARRLGLPLVVTFHGYDATTHDTHLLASRLLRDRRLVTRRPQLIREATLFIAVSEHIRRQLLARGFPPQKVVTHYNGIDTTFFSPLPGQVPPDEPVVLFVGRFVEKKGTSYLLQAMSEVQRAVPDARLILIGDGPLRGPLEELSRQLGLRCDFLGKRPIGVVREHMRAAQVFCVPSVTASTGDTEGLPTVLLEALALGLPTVTTDSAGNPEAVTDGQTGFVVPERDVAALAHAITTLLGDSDLRGHFREEALRDVRVRFDSRRLGRELEALYASVASLGAQAHAEFQAYETEALDRA